MLLINQAQGSNVLDYTAALAGKSLVDTYTALIPTWPVLQPVVAEQVERRPAQRAEHPPEIVLLQALAGPRRNCGRRRGTSDSRSPMPSGQRQQPRRIGLVWPQYRHQILTGEPNPKYYMFPSH